MGGIPLNHPWVTNGWVGNGGEPPTHRWATNRWEGNGGDPPHPSHCKSFFEMTRGEMHSSGDHIAGGTSIVGSFQYIYIYIHTMFYKKS